LLPPCTPRCLHAKREREREREGEKTREKRDGCIDIKGGKEMKYEEIYKKADREKRG